MIDISRFLHGSEAERAAVAAAWDEAFTGVGFCLLTGFESLLVPLAVVFCALAKLGAGDHTIMIRVQPLEIVLVLDLVSSR